MRGASLSFTSTKKSCFEADDCQPAMTAADEFNVSTCLSSFIYVFCTKAVHFEMWAALRDACCCIREVLVSHLGSANATRVNRSAPFSGCPANMCEEGSGACEEATILQC